MCAELVTDRRSAEWDIRFAGRNYLTLVGMQGIASLSAFAAMWVSTHLLMADGYGSVIAIISASQLVLQIGLAWSNVSVARFGCEEFVETGRLARTFWTRLSILLPNLLVLALTFPFWAGPAGTLLKIPPKALWLVPCYMGVQSLWLHVQFALQGAKLQKTQSMLLASEKMGVLILLAMWWAAGAIAVSAVIAIYIAGSLLAMVAGIRQLWPLIYPGICIDRKLLKRILIFSLPLLPYSVTAYFSTNYLDSWFILRSLSIAHLGVYTVAYQISGTVTQLPQLASNLLMPMLLTLQQRNEERVLEGFMREVAPFLSLVWTIACSILAALGTVLLPLVFGYQFRAAADLIWPLMAASAVAGPVFLGLGSITNVKSATYISMAAAIVAAFLNLTLDYLLIPRFGLPGCAWSTTIAYGGSLLTFTIFVSRRLKLSSGAAVQVTLPAAAGALYATTTGRNLEALAIALAAAALMALLHRNRLAGGLRAVSTRLHNLPRRAAPE